MAEQFTAIVEPHEKMRGLEVPPEVVEALGGGKRPRVVVTIGRDLQRNHRTELRLVVLRHRPTRR